MANKYLNLTGLGTLVDQIKGKFALKSSLDDLKGNVESLSKALVFKGVATSADDLNIPSAKVGDVYIASPKSGTFSVGGQYVESGDMIIAQTVTSTPTPSVTWAVVQANINGAVTATADITAEHVVVGSGRKTVKDLIPSSAGYLYWNGTKHVYQTPSAYTLSPATTTALGGINIGYTNSDTNRNYGVKLDTTNKAYANVPWESVSITTVENGVKRTKTGNDVTFVISKVENANFALSAGSASTATGYDDLDLQATINFATKFKNIDDRFNNIPSFEAITETEITNLFK